MEMIEAEESTAVAQVDPKQPQTSLFPIFSFKDESVQSNSHAPQWLSNTSFTTELSVINEVFSSQGQQSPASQSEDECEDEDQTKSREEDQRKHSVSYELLESSASDQERDKHGSKGKKKRKRKHMNLGKDSTATRDPDGLFKRKPNVRSWASSDTKLAKEYYFDSRGDRDNLAFGSIYKMDVARYKLYNSSKWGLKYHALYRKNGIGSRFDGDADIDVLDSKLKSDGRYWSAKYTAVERHKNLKRLRLTPRKKPTADSSPGDFISLSDLLTSGKGDDGGSVRDSSVLEESWEDEVFRKTREFNRMTRERPQDEKIWLSFSEFQDKVSSMQPQKGARLQTLEKKISILEKATELNPDSEELLLSLLKAYQTRDSGDALFSRWEKILLKHSGSSRLWKEFLQVYRNDFSRFKVSDMRKMYAHAIQALSAECSKHRRQINLTFEPQQLDAEAIQLELGLVDIFVGICRFEWQAGYRELATALFQAEIEYSLLSPPLLLTEHGKQRLFEHFWNGNGSRIGEDGALGWSTWLEKEEEDRQRIIRDENLRENDRGGWTGWSAPLSRNEEVTDNPTILADESENINGPDEQHETDEINHEDDSEALLKMLGIDAGTEAVGDVRDSRTWIRWSEEESSRDSEQWMPLRGKPAAVSSGDGTPDRDVDDQLMRVVLFEDVSEYLFSVSSREARFSLVSQFVNFYGGKISQFCTNSSTWLENVLGSEVMPDCMIDELRRVHEVLVKTGSNLSSSSLESILGDPSVISRRKDMFKFLRNAILLCLTTFPRNYVLEEAVLAAEDLYNTGTDSHSCSITPCRSLARSLLKSDRQDVLLCGVYAQREAAFGNLGHARKIFDMALSSVEGLPLDQKSGAPLLYFWYAELELTSGSSSSPETRSRAVHILSTLGSSTSYHPYKCRPSNLQILRARQGFIDHIKTQRSAWARGIIDEHSVALICSAALFEELTTGLAVALDVLTEALSVVLPQTRSQNYQLEFLLNYYVGMLFKNHKKLNLSKVWGPITHGLQMYPFSPKLFSTLVEVGHLYTVPVKLRRMLDDYCRKRPSVTAYLFALSFEVCRSNSRHRIRSLFEKALGDDRLHNSVLLWRCYIAYEVDMASDLSAAKRIFFRAIHACPWSKKLWLDGFLKLNTILSVKELSDLQEVMRDKELNLRTDVYEILLQDELI